MLCAKYNLQSEQTFETPCIIQENHMTMTLIKQQSQTKTMGCFQSHFKVKQIGSDSAWSHCSSPANQSAF